MTYTRRINVRGIIYHDGKLFCQRLTPGADGITRNYWCTPGGGMDDGETLLQALHREMIEETGVAPDIGKLLFVQQFHDGAKEQLEFFFEIKNVTDYQAIDLANTSHGLAEVASCDFVQPSDHTILPAFLQTYDIAAALATNQPVYIASE